jgi:hypothetical protein
MVNKPEGLLIATKLSSSVIMCSSIFMAMEETFSGSSIVNSEM